MGFFDIFRPLKTVKAAKWRELGSYTAKFYNFGTDIYRAESVRECVRVLADHTAKANAVCTDERIQRLLNLKPNVFMNGFSFLKKIRSIYEIKGVAFIYIQRDEKNKVIGFYPLPIKSFEGVESGGRLYINFEFESGVKKVIPWADLAVLRRDYFRNDVGGDGNDAILDKLDLISTTEQGVGNAVKSTANLRGILKMTKTMLDDEDVKKAKDNFVRDYMNLGNEGGIASLDATQEFTPINMNPTIAGADTLKVFKDDVQKYYGVSDKMLKSECTPEELEVFYESKIEPFLVDLSTALTAATFTDKELGFKNKIEYESNRMQYASLATKLQMVDLVDRGVITPNEYRLVLNLAPYEGGDEFIRRLDTAGTGRTSDGEDVKDE